MFLLLAEKENRKGTGLQSVKYSREGYPHPWKADVVASYRTYCKESNGSTLSKPRPSGRGVEGLTKWNNLPPVLFLHDPRGLNRLPFDEPGINLKDRI